MSLVARDVIDTRPAPVPAEAGSLMQIIGRIAQDPSVDLDRFERLIAMQERMEARQAERAFTAALSAMQPNLPTIEQNGTILIHHKDDSNKPASEKRVIQSTAFAKWEDISEAIRPHLAEHGFTLTFKAEREADRVIITATLSHREGHKESTSLPLALDTTGSKNNVQAVGSSISYGKRYTAGLLLNITSRAKNEADDDGIAADTPATVSDEQIIVIRELIEATGSNQKLFLKWAKADSIADIPAVAFDEVVAKLREKEARR